MIKKVCAASIAAAMLSNAYGQSSVQIFGLLDEGVTYVSNQNGSKNVKLDGQGIYTPNFFGFQGEEDLGGGTKAIFKLVDKFDLGTGAFIPGASLFSETAYVGLKSGSYGTLTMGRQYDFMTDSLLFTGTDATRFGLGFYNFRNGPFPGLQLPNNPTGAFNWDRMAGAPVSNSVKYVSPSVAGFSLGALYGFGGVAGNFGSKNAASFGLTYANGPFTAGAAYTNQKFPGPVNGSPQTSVSNWGTGAVIKYGSFSTNALVTTVQNSLSGGHIYMVQLGQTWAPAPDMLVAADYMYMKGNENLFNNHAHQMGASFSYFLSKRTVLYVEGIYQKANNGAQALVNGFYDGASSSSSQAVARVGIQTSF